jgi:hypothetical protein
MTKGIHSYPSSLNSVVNPAEMQPMGTACPCCHSVDTRRRHRYGPFDYIRAWFNHWPYRCLECGKGFYSSQRYSSRDACRSAQEGQAASGRRSASPQMAYRTDPGHPLARIVLQADTHAQMNKILLALSQAVQSFASEPLKQTARTTKSDSKTCETASH